MNDRQGRFIKGCFLILAIGTLPVLFQNVFSYIAGLLFIGLLSVAFSRILF